MKLDFEKQDGLIPAIIQDASTGQVLMLAYLNEQAWTATVETGIATFWSRSRQKLWIKGESSGHKLIVRELLTDCDADAVVLRVEPIGPGVCHEGYVSCFFRSLKDGKWQVAGTRAFDPSEVYA
jgi:phosphoribosyl-AMP cyclohydrolase